MCQAFHELAIVSDAPRASNYFYNVRSTKLVAIISQGAVET